MVKYVSVSPTWEVTESIMKPQKKKSEELDPDITKGYHQDDLLAFLRTKVNRKGKGPLRLIGSVPNPPSATVVYLLGFLDGTAVHGHDYLCTPGGKPTWVYDEMLMVACTSKKFLLKTMVDFTGEETLEMLALATSRPAPVSKEEDEEEDGEPVDETDDYEEDEEEREDDDSEEEEVLQMIEDEDEEDIASEPIVGDNDRLECEAYDYPPHIKTCNKLKDNDPEN